MVNERQQLSFGGSFSATSIMILTAALLILLGIVFQLGELGYGHLGAQNFWFVSMVAQSAWNMLSMRGNGPAFDEVVRWWPLALVSMGLAILLLRQGARKIADSKREK